jgi:hypothetical protein
MDGGQSSRTHLMTVNCMAVPIRRYSVQPYGPPPSPLMTMTTPPTTVTTSSNHAPLTHPDINHSHPTLTPTLLNYYTILL